MLPQIPEGTIDPADIDQIPGITRSCLEDAPLAAEGGVVQ